ncbi:unnamed protein product [Effrenium voratum]|uniref:Uncharacterized protein n=1 Tax=Effrenium voratum TaxID=2562239 RepID=A0AA36HXS4_9DINO|nr:unnamed protein product [Effrenium voratum]CAJ1443902.1 unnamed protein product [Effrenium voratum]
MPGLLLPFAALLRWAPVLRPTRGLAPATRRFAAPRRGAVESYAKVSVLCSRCGELLARYRKRNGTKSNLIKMYVERIAEDTHSILAMESQIPACGENKEIACPGCERSFCRGPRLVKGRPAWKIIAGRVRMK